jgi:hypothetical protein
LIVLGGEHGAVPASAAHGAAGRPVAATHHRRSACTDTTFDSAAKFTCCRCVQALLWQR